MTVTSVSIMQCVPADSGQLVINRVGVGVGVILYSKSRKIGVGVHILAPLSGNSKPENPAKFANSAIPYALEIMVEKGGMPPYSVAVTGGATMAGSPSGANIGSKTVEAVRQALSDAKLNISMDKTGGSNIKSMRLDFDTGNIDIE